MRFNCNDKKGLGAIGAVILVILLLAVSFIGATAVMPFAGQQNVTAGDTLTFSSTLIEGGVTTNYTETFTFNSVSATSVNFTITYDDVFPDQTNTTGAGHSGNMFYAELFNGYFIDPANPPSEPSYTYLIVGFTPMLVESYVFENGGDSYEFLVKAGTSLIVGYYWTDGTDSLTSTLTGSSIMWVTLF